IAICRYENAAVRLTPTLVDRVLELYFARTVAVGMPTGTVTTGGLDDHSPATAANTSILAAR
ncbi:MAG TPA: hypothetical protein PLV93_13135, partial [Microthrixaceae bacterium]|nr:hypothetical protein [Microthrixaceae bacterium]